MPMFMMADDSPTLFLFVLAEDVMRLRSGNTLCVEPRMTGGRFFNTVIVSQHKTKDEVVKLLRSINPTCVIPDHLPEPPPREGEVACEGCKASGEPDRLLEGRCIVCWRLEAMKYRTASN